MLKIFRSPRGIVAFFVAAVAIFGLAPAIAQASPLTQLPGRWSGWGAIVFDSGTREKIKCVATYFVKKAAKNLQQNLRCTTSASYKIDARSELILKGNRLNGTWVERKTGNTGDVSGTMNDTGFKLSIKGPAFGASMQVNTGSCKQTLSIRPTGLGVKRISITLNKC